MHRFKKIALSVMLVLVLVAPILSPFAESFSFPDRYDLVAILVEQGVYADEVDYDGLAGSASGPLEKTTLKARVDRYAIDVQNALPGTRAVVIQVDRFEKPENIAAVLERLYVDGDPKEPTRTAYLKGVVIVGEVPLPVVNKNGSRFISLFPYTDFEAPAYVWNRDTKSFEIRQENPTPQPEIWHGVIRPPVSTQIEDGKKLLAAYFDKNHLYHLGDPLYASFDKKIFFQDFLEEKKNLNASAYKNYLNFLDHAGDVAYLRYTKELFKDLSGPFEQEMAQDEAEAAGLMDELANAGIPLDSNVPRPNLPPDIASQIPAGARPNAVDKNKIPDIMTKIGKMSDNLMMRFNQLFSKYPNLINDFVRYTGRYDTADSAVNLITAKDQYTIQYMKEVNTMIEKKIDEIVAALQKNISLTQARLQVTSGHRTYNGQRVTIPTGIPAVSNPPVEYVNFTPAFSNGGNNFGPRLNGAPLFDVTSVAQCTPYRGSKGTGSYSKLVEVNRALNEQSGSDYDVDRDLTTGRTSAEKSADYQCHFEGRREGCEGYEHFAGCFYEGSNLYTNPASGAQVCFPEHATDPVLDPAGTRAVGAVPNTTFDNFRSCLTFYEKNQYTEYLKSVDDRLERIDDDYTPDPNNPAANRQRKVSALQSVPLKPKDKHPDTIVVFSGFYIEGFSVSLGDILRGLGWNATQNPTGWRDTLATLLESDVPPNNRSVQISGNPRVEDVQFSLTRVIGRSISSVMYHKEPTVETLNAQAKNLITSELPIDNPRYVTFQNRNSGVSRVTYPDLFTVPTANEYLQTLVNLETQLNSLPRAPGSTPPCANCLTSLVSDAPEVSRAIGGGSEVTRANRSKVTDALLWRDLDIDSKHKYLAEYYLDSVKNAYVGEVPNGYEMFYVNGEGSADRYSFSFTPSEPDTDPALVSAQESAHALEQEKEDAYDDDPENPFDNPPPTVSGSGSGYDLFSFSPPPISPWWERMKEWAQDLKERTEQFRFGEPEEAFYGSLKESNEKLLEEIRNENRTVEANLLTADELNFSRVAKLSFAADSSMVVGGKRIDLTLRVLDKNNSPVRDEFAKITLDLVGGGRFTLDTPDELPTEAGHQITVMSGEKRISFIAPEAPANVELTAVHPDTEVKASLSFAVVPEAKLTFEADTTAAIANGTNVIHLDIFARDANGVVIADAKSRVRLALSDPQMGRLSAQEVQLVSGKASVNFTVGKKKGVVVLNATTPSFDPGSLSLSLLPGLPVRIGLSADSDTLSATPGSSVQLQAALFDVNGNLVDTNSAVSILFRITQKTARFGTLATTSERVTNGVASTRLLPREETGIVNVIAESPGLQPGFVSVASMKQFGANEVRNMKLNTLTAALLGIPAGAVNEAGYLGGWFTMQGKTQAVTTLTTLPKQYKKLFEVDAQGGLRIEDPTHISTHFVPANTFTMVLRDEPLQLDIARVSLVPQKEGQFAVTDVAEPEKLGDGIYLRNLGVNEDYAADIQRGALRLTKDQSEKLEVQTNGFVRIFDNDFSLRPAAGTFLILEVLDKGTPVAEIFFVQRFNQDVRLQEVNPEAPGVYLQTFKLPPFVITGRTFGGNSTAVPQGIAVYDKREEVKGASAPGFAFNSLEDSLDRFGIGFTEDNKFALLFSAGELFGEANRHFASDIGIVLGDPTVRISNRDPNDFSADTGKLLYTASADVRAILPFDYNSDGFEDVLVVEGEGKVRLIQNNGGYDQMKDQGFLFDIKNGIQDITKIDFNNDGQMDLAVAAMESCRKGETCIDLYENRSAEFVRRNLRIDQKEKIVTIRAEDMNRDGFSDLVFADTAGEIKILYNRRGQFIGAPQLIGNVGLRVDPTKNLIENVLVRYSGMAPKNTSDPGSVQMYQALNLREPNPGATREGFGGFLPPGSGADVTIEESYVNVQRDFIYADLDTQTFANSSKSAQDLNGGIVQTDDRIKYTIVLRNDSVFSRTGVAVSDVLAEQLELDPRSIRCADCAEGEMRIERLTGDSSRPYLFSGIRIPARSSRRIEYEAIFRGDTGSADKITLTFNNRFEDLNPAIQGILRRDNYPDIAVSKERNPTGRVRYFYTAGIDPNGVLAWGSELSSPPVPLSASSFSERTGLPATSQADAYDYPTKCMLGGIEIRERKNQPDACKRLGGTPEPTNAPASAQSSLSDVTDKDSDGDGLPDSIDDVNGALDGIAAATEGLISSLKCDAGCIAMPMNIAFLAPGLFSIMGVPDGFDPGLPVFGWGAPNIIPTWPPTPHPSTLGGRFYISPTLTGGVGFALCLGPYGSPKNCFSFGVNPLDLIPGNVCDKINNATSSVLATASDAVGKLNEGVTVTAGANSGGTIGAGSRRASGSGLGNYSLGSYDAPVAKSRNVRIPGFPSVITEWFSRQTEEFTDKVLSLPDIYVLYPSGDSLVGSVIPTQRFPTETITAGNAITNTLSWLNSIPLIDIQTKEVLFKVPIVTRKEIEVFTADARQWIEDETLELNKWETLVGCAGVSGTPLQTAANPDTCRFVSVQLEGLINGVAENMRALDEWILFPKKLIQYRAIESYYLGQIIDYLDTMIEFTGGWVKRNTARVKQWRRAIRQMRDVIDNWKIFSEVMVDYQESCDQCKTERYSLKDLILKLFIAIPSPPVIPLPKLPDIIIDVSKVQAGLTIEWPDVKFKAEPMTLPRLPRFSLGAGLTIPEFKLLVPSASIPVIPRPPELPTLPSLPELNLPKLPDLPPPPKLPQFPGSFKTTVSLLKKIVKILCIVRLGLVPTDEFLLKTRIEEITARGLTPVLPIDTIFTVQSPTISATYVDQLIITAFTNLKIDFSTILRVVEDAAKKANAFSTDLTKGTNAFTKALSEQIEKVTSPTINLENIQINYNDEETLTRELSRLFKADATELVHLGMQLKRSFDVLEDARIEQERVVKYIPSSISLVAGMQAYTPPSSSGTAPRSRIAESGLALPVQKRLQAYRNTLIRYVEDTERLIALNSPDLADLNPFIARERSPFVADSLKSFVAANSFELPARGTGENQLMKVGSADFDSIDWVPHDDSEADESNENGQKEEENRLIAFELTPPPALPLPTSTTPGAGGPAASGSIQDIGIFFIDVNGQSKRLVNYTLEAGKPSKLANIDIENDGDTDKLYSYGENVFLKQNAKRVAPESRPTFRSVDIEFWTIFELLPAAAGPQFPKVVDEKTSESSITFEKPSFDDLAGYEVVAKNSPYFFERAGNFKTVRAHLLSDALGGGGVSELAINLVNPEGEVRINGEAPKSLTVRVGDYIETGENTTATLEASDGTRLRISQNTAFVVRQGGTFELLKGALGIELPQAGSALFPHGTVFAAATGTLRLRLFDGSEVTVRGGSSFTLPAWQPVYANLKGISGSARFTGSKREYIQPRSGVIRVFPGEVLHPLQVVRLEWNTGSPGAHALALSKDIMLTVPDTFANGLDIKMDEGVLEIIRGEESTQPVAAGMALVYGDQIEVQTGVATVHYARGGDTVVRANETYSLQKLEETDNPTLKLDLDPAMYFARVYAFDSNGKRSNGSERVVMAPQVCGDDTPPFANTGRTEFEVAVGKTIPLDGTRSFDTEGKVISYWLDVDTSVDSDGDGIATNDRDLWRDTDPAIDADGDGNPSNDPDDAFFTLGPYQEVGSRQMRMTVLDEGLNEGYQDITVTIVTPRIVLDEIKLRSGVIGGFVEPADTNVPITIARNRSGKIGTGWEVLRTPSADANGQYFTDARGTFEIKDLDLRDRLVVRNSEGKIVAEINKTTGRIIITDSRYETRFAFSSPPQLPTRIGIHLKTDSGVDTPLTFVYFVPDVNTDVSLDGLTVNYDALTVGRMSGVHMKPLQKAYDRRFTFTVLPGNDPRTPGAALVTQEGKEVALVDVNGDITPRDAKVTVREKSFGENPGDQPVVFEMLYDGEVIAEIVIPVRRKDAPQQNVTLVDAAKLPARPTPLPPPTAHPFTDVSPADPFSKTAEKLYKRGIIAGYPSTVRGELLFKPDNAINRAEFTQMSLKMLCIVPRAEAKILPSPFYDVLDPKLWFYPVLKEGNIRGFIKGYIGEALLDAATGATRTPFKPANDITWAEAATVVLAALQEQDIIAIPPAMLTATPGAPWYEPYVAVAQDLKPYLIDPADAQTRAFLLTAGDALKAGLPISRRDFAIMAERVLLIRDCYIESGALSPDEGETTPVIPPEERPQLPADVARNQEGIFVLNPACNTCPCRATIGEGSQLLPGDLIFAAITGPNGIPIYAQSNEVNY